MPSTLITDWTGYAAAIADLLHRAQTQLCVFDADLRRPGLEARDNAALLERFLCADRRNTLRIVVVDAAPLRAECPRLMRLLATHSAQMHVLCLAPDIVTQTASLLIVDDRHTLIRFSNDQPRARLIIDDAAATAPYVEQYAQLLASSGDPVSATTLGL